MLLVSFSLHIFFTPPTPLPLTVQSILTYFPWLILVLLFPSFHRSESWNKINWPSYTAKLSSHFTEPKLSVHHELFSHCQIQSKSLSTEIFSFFFQVFRRQKCSWQNAFNAKGFLSEIHNGSGVPQVTLYTTSFFHLKGICKRIRTHYFGGLML